MSWRLIWRNGIQCSLRACNEISIWVVFCVEFDGDIRLCVAPPKSRFLMIFLDFLSFFAIFCFCENLGFSRKSRIFAKVSGFMTILDFHENLGFL